MDKSIVIDGIEYNNYTEQEPEFKQGNLKNYKLYYKIFPEDYNKLNNNTIIAYQIDNNKYNCGFIIKFIEPNIFILKDTRLYYIWSVIINHPTQLYVKDIALYKRENNFKDKLFEEYKKQYSS